MIHVVAELILFLIAQDRKRRDGSDKLIVAEGFKARDVLRRRSERKIKGETEIRVAHGGQMQPAGVEYERADPVRIESVLLADNQVQIMLCEVAPVEGSAACCTMALCVT